jgi:hypothetical protein
MLVKPITTEYGFEADKWIITQFPYTRINEKEFDVKIIIECFREREDYFKNKRTSFGRSILHVTTDHALTMEEMYKHFREPILKGIPQEQVEGEESKDPIFEDINFFRDAKDVIV